MFLAWGRLTATLPPMDASTMAAMLVGTCTKGTPRTKVLAMNPPKSPATPPPMAMIGWPRSAFRPTSHS